MRYERPPDNKICIFNNQNVMNLIHGYDNRYVRLIQTINYLGLTCGWVYSSPQNQYVRCRYGTLLEFVGWMMDGWPDGRGEGRMGGWMDGWMMDVDGMGWMGR